MSTDQFLDKKRMEREKLFSTCALVRGKLFSFTDFMRVPIMGDLHTGKITLLHNLKNYDPVFSVDNMLSIGDNVFILELDGKRLMKYNIKERNCSYFNIDCNSKSWGNFAVFAHCGRSIYIFPIYEDGFLRVNIESGEVQKKKELYAVINEYKADKKQGGEITYFWQGCQLENKVWLFQRYGSLVVVYDMVSDTWKKYELSVRIKECTHVTSYSGSLYILNAEGKVYRWNMSNEPIEKVVDCRRANTTDLVFSRIAVTDKRLFLLPALGKDIFYLDLNTKKIIKYDSYPEDFQYCGPENWSKYYGYCEDNDWYYFTLRSANYILTINKRNGIEKWVKADFPNYEEYKKVYLHYNKKQLYEAEWNVRDIISYINKKNVEMRYRKCISGGEKIWDYVKETK